MQANSDIPLEATRLGALVSTHRVEFSKRIWGYILLLGLGIPFLIWGVSLIITGTRFAQSTFLIAGAVMCLWGLWSVLVAWRKGYPPRFGNIDASDSSATKAMIGSWSFAGGLIFIVGALITKRTIRN